MRKVLAAIGVLFAVFFIFSWFLTIRGQTVKVANPTMAINEDTQEEFKKVLKDYADSKDCSVKVDVFTSEKPNGTEYLNSMNSDVRAIYSIEDSTLYYNTSLAEDLVVVQDVTQDNFVSTMKDVIAEVARNKEKNFFTTTFKMEGTFMHILAYIVSPLVLLALSVFNLRPTKKKKKNAPVATSAATPKE